MSHLPKETKIKILEGMLNRLERPRLRELVALHARIRALQSDLC